MNAKVAYNYKTTPYYKNGCSHGGYLFSFTCVEPGERLQVHLDVYCFDGSIGQEFCIRYGNKEYEYCSPGSVVNIIEAQRHLQRYRAVVELLREDGNIVFVHK